MIILLTITKTSASITSNTDRSSIVSIVKSTMPELRNITMSNMNQTVIEMVESELKSSSQLVLTSITLGSSVKISQESKASISDSSFISLGGSTLIKGAALTVKDSNLTVVNSSFVENIALNGGSIDLSCSVGTKCAYSFSDSIFESNKATNVGGAIRYDLFSPDMTNITYTNNSAVYGPNIGSYPVKVQYSLSSSNVITLQNVVSGLQYDHPITLKLVDGDGQTMVMDSASQIEIRAVSGTNQSVAGTTVKKVNQGVATFDAVTFKSSPGDTDVKFEIHSNALDSEVLTQRLGSSYSQTSIMASFRY